MTPEVTLDQALAAYLARRWGEPVAIHELARISGGASRETWRLDALVAGKRRPLSCAAIRATA